MENLLTKRAILFQGFIDSKKGSPDYYSSEVMVALFIALLIDNNEICKEYFDGLPEQRKWDYFEMFPNKKYLCKMCGCSQIPERVFMGSIECDVCGNELTRRTNGGQNNPFNYTLKK